MARITFVAAAFVAAIWPVPSIAQDTLTLDDALRAAAANNASLRAARAGADEASAHASEARALFFPRVAISESWQRGDQPVFVFSSLLSSRRFTAANFAIDALNHPDPLGFFHTSVSVEQLIFDGGRVRAGAAGAGFQQRAASEGANEAAAAMALSVSEAFGRLLSAQAAVQAAEAALAAAREDQARAERRRDAGLATDADVLALVVHVSAMQQRAIQSRGDTAVARAGLNRLMGAPIERECAAVEPSVVRDHESAAPLADLFREAEAARPEIRRANAAVDATREGRRQARAGFLPQVAAQAAFDVGGTTFIDRASSWIVGGEVRWTLSLGGAEQARVSAAAQAEARRRAERDDAIAAVQVEVVTALRQLEAAEARTAASRDAVAQARESQRIIRDRFDAGLASVNDVLRAASALMDAETARTAALVDRVVSGARLRHALGRTL